jgi:hypothetical protein
MALALLFWATTAFSETSSEDAHRPIVAETAALERASVLAAGGVRFEEQRQTSSASTALDSSSLGSIAEVKQSKRANRLRRRVQHCERVLARYHPSRFPRGALIVGGRSRAVPIAATFFQLDRRISMIDLQLTSQLPLVESQD